MRSDTALRMASEVLEVVLLGQLIVGRLVDELADLLDRALEDGLLARELGVAVVGREGDFDVQGLVDFGADQLILEARDEGARAELKHVVLGLAARELRTIDRAHEVELQRIALLCGARRVDRLLLTVGLGDAIDGVVDVLRRHLRLQPLELDAGEIELADLGQHLDRDLELDILAFSQLLEVDARLQRRPQPAILDRLGRALVHRLLERLAVQRLAILLLEQADRHLALAEAGQLGGLGELGQALVDLGRQVARRDDDLELPLQPVS